MGVVADQAAAITAVLNTVTDIGKVLDHQPYPVKDWAGFVSTLSYDPGTGREVRAWTLQLVAEERKPLNIASFSTKVKREMQWLVRGHMSINEGSSDVAFRNLVEAVMDAIDTARSMSGTMQDHDPCDLSLPGDGAPVALGETVVHYCEIRFTGWIEATYQST